MDKKAWIVGGLAALISVGATAADVKWDYKQLKNVEAVALEVLIKSQGAVTDEEIAAAKDLVESYTVKKGIQGDSVQATVIYKKNGVKKTISKMCHEHDPGEIDCH